MTLGELNRPPFCVSNMRATFPASARLHSPTEYAHALKGRRIARGALFVVMSPRLSSDSEQARLGLIVPKRFAGKAVTRNAIKRVIRESFRHQRHKLPPADYVFRLHSKVPDCSLTQLKQLVRLEAETILSKACHS